MGMEETGGGIGSLPGFLSPTFFSECPRSIFFLKETFSGVVIVAIAKLTDQSLEGRTIGSTIVMPHYAMRVRIQGISRLLFHRYDPEAVERKNKASKGSREKKTDNLESYLYRDLDGYLGIPATNIKACILNAAKHFSDPRSTGQKKQAKELFAATIFVEPEMCPVLVDGKRIKEPQFVDRRGVVVQRSRVNRERPGLLPGWQCEFTVNVLAPEYVTPELLRDVLSVAGRFVGLGDFRPDFGRFQVVSTEMAG